ncbi:hypothetical protein LCGC14_2341360 [marine sediment metagenome]|uniref:Uncharacterized protein n=1 Tax=marine sediment metagenome TaxID=412755 RepID=A0A0F9CBV4_9ZZZZ
MALEPTKKLGVFLDTALKFNKALVAESKDIQRRKEEVSKAPGESSHLPLPPATGPSL